ncbi:MAG TPA: flagellar filament capping protein FliD [Sedimentisphaerales bacterium]|nr:flagellar filament capping protein FliD [Sedimentisphaerales bacterium]
MSTLRLPGLLTGIDTNTLIAQLMAVERRRVDVYEQRKSVWEEKQDALSTLETKLSTLASSIRALSDANELRAFSAASSDSDKVTAEATYNAYEGNHTVVVNQLATAERWVHTAGVEYLEDYIGEGTFIYSYNHKEVMITTAAATTLEDLVGLINNDPDNPGVTASLLNYNDAYHLVLNGNQAGTDYEISINASNTEVWQAESAFTFNNDNAALGTKITDLDQFDLNGGSFAGDERIRITGHTHDGTVVDVYMDVTANTKLFHVMEEINDAFAGAATATLENGKIVLTDHTSGESQMDLALTYDPGTGPTTMSMPTISQSTQGGGATADLKGFAEADFTETQSAQDSQIRVDGYPEGDWIERSSNTIDDVIYGVTLHLHDTTDASGEEITLTRDIASVKQKLNSMIDAYNFVMQHVKEKTGYNDVLKTAGVLMGDYVVSGIRWQLLNPLIAQTSGFVTDVDTFLMPGQIGLELDKDGVLSLNTNVFDQAIAQDYMGVLAIIGADKTGSSNSNTIEFYGASGDYTTAGSYDVEVTISGGVITGARIKLSSESTYRDATFSGNIVTGDSTFDDNSNPVYPENGLQLSVDLSQTGTFTATVRVKQGFTGAIEDALDNMLKATTGSVQIDQEHIDDQIEYLQDRIDVEQERLTRTEARLVARYARLERTLALMQNQLAALGFGTG